ncbi:Uncharacterised protein [Mycobacterium tuberculosis]|uniref:Uncharacterized protein n=2 Tax=Mycobacterium tuberculosis TaxID=1773 RepID=A0A0T7M195_MYCTX|nr:Uncharacterised protein [Mycobacterium tuberculosis]CFS12760.1 Uncharacterised protein [Mycobacterium tuberculosis]CFS35675.1 Uncharacterised protein [Mycobacterium tuberculosis]CNV36645.1 Uncharacterised protein [Mycobacterium tuberculosis]CNV49652.1 Uncharacterised protein [Mycobacterium tuberculosis]
MDTRGDPAEQQRVGHVVGAVAEVGQPQAAQRPLAFGDGLQVGQHLTRMELIGERVDHGHRRDRRHGVQPLLAEGSPDDGIDVAGQHLCGVLQGFVAAQLGAAAVDDDGMPAQLRDAQLEGEPGAGGVLVEDDRHPARPLQGTTANRVFLQLGRELEHLGLFGRGQIVVAQEMPDHGAPTARSRIAGKAATKPSSCASAMISGGANRMTSGAAALTR